jgi:hypothetical protein
VEWAEQYRRHWDERMDRLEDYLRQLQQQEKEEAESQERETKDEFDRE